MRPTVKMYNDDAIQSAHNWRQNYDAMTEEKNIYYWEMIAWMEKASQRLRHYPLLVVVGVMIGVIGTLIVASGFNLN